jgi:hypothetical protein
MLPATARVTFCEREPFAAGLAEGGSIARVMLLGRC